MTDRTSFYSTSTPLDDDMELTPLGASSAPDDAPDDEESLEREDSFELEVEEGDNGNGGNGAEPPTVTLATLDGESPEVVDRVADEIRQYLTAQGNATRIDIRRYLRSAGISQELYSKAWERIQRQLNMLTEVSRPDGQRAWTVKQEYQDLPFAQIIAIAFGLGKEKKKREIFSDYYRATGFFTFLSPCLSSNPNPEDPSSRLFLRNQDDSKILMLSGYFAGMFKQACALPWAPQIGNARFRVSWSQQSVDASLVKLTLRPVPPDRPGGPGKGVTSVESLAAGTQLPFGAWVPGSHVTPAEFELLMEYAGEYCGISPSAAHKGWGRFVPTFTAPVAS